MLEWRRRQAVAFQSVCEVKGQLTLVNSVKPNPGKGENFRFDNLSSLIGTKFGLGRIN